jgi:predicted RNase H-like HicB family nuclease
MQAYDFKVLLEPDEEAGGYIVTCPALPGCYTQGDMVDEALENIKEAILLCLEDMIALGRTDPRYIEKARIAAADPARCKPDRGRIRQFVETVARLG